ncbi:hypothetical protein CANARDRAFT_175051 [[Candida] arabinofermentans NRRL YB-2248]|uniref:Uncharacterized protein n=1 Tax=[Candida] arabinofermentans NRRL YB-2248 TaxID=983967 RepID=A0A1E4T5J6_9ASCO|nr:hypothetical protein CANARDRAFT_175051 [[Candida] arabinofermentans NRRL YB-2248]
MSSVTLFARFQNSTSEVAKVASATNIEVAEVSQNDNSETSTNQFYTGILPDESDVASEENTDSATNQFYTGIFPDESETEPTVTEVTDDCTETESSVCVSETPIIEYDGSLSANRHSSSKIYIDGTNKFDPKSFDAISHVPSSSSPSFRSQRPDSVPKPKNGKILKNVDRSSSDIVIGVFLLFVFGFMIGSMIYANSEEINKAFKRYYRSIRGSNLQDPEAGIVEITPEQTKEES